MLLLLLLPLSLLSSGDSILKRAQELKRFVNKQKGKVAKNTAKREWLLAYSKLREECQKVACD